MQSFVREGDTVFCHSMDRLARNLDDLRRIVLGLTERGVHIVFVKENLTFTGDDSPMSNLLLSVMMGALATADKAFVSWATRPERGKIISPAAPLLLERKSELAKLATLEMGTGRGVIGTEKAGDGVKDVVTK
jgi:DNA invertase Pin-like site-specific DNA recombinase